MANVPTLRFPGFTDEWEILTLGKICDTFEYGMNVPAKEYDGENRYIRITDIDDCSHLYSLLNEVSPDGNLEDKYLVKEGDILFARTGASVGKSYIYRSSDGKLYFAGFLIRAHVRCEYNPFFVFYQTLTSKYSKWVNIMSARSGQPGINSQEYASYQLSVPPMNEQKKLADFLSLIDERIALQSKLIDRLKSLMDGIIDKVTALTPNISIGECLDCYSSTLQECETEEQGTYPVYGANGVCGYLDYATISAPAILIVKDGSGVGNVSYANGDCSVVGTLNYLQPKRDVSAKFLYFVLKRFNFQPYKTGMAIPHIYFKAYSKTRIFCPDYEEQTRMAASLSRIEDKIALEERLLCLLQEQKHYLLSAMFI